MTRTGYTFAFRFYLGCEERDDRVPFTKDMNPLSDRTERNAYSTVDVRML